MAASSIGEELFYRAAIQVSAACPFSVWSLRLLLYNYVEETVLCKQIAYVFTSFAHIVDGENTEIVGGVG